MTIMEVMNEAVENQYKLNERQDFLFPQAYTLQLKHGHNDSQRDNDPY